MIRYHKLWFFPISTSLKIFETFLNLFSFKKMFYHFSFFSFFFCFFVFSCFLLLFLFSFFFKTKGARFLTLVKVNSGIARDALTPKSRALKVTAPPSLPSLLPNPQLVWSLERERRVLPPKHQTPILFKNCLKKLSVFICFCFS